MSPKDIRTISISDLSDRYGRLHELARRIETETNALKAEFKRRGLGGVQLGAVFAVTIGEAEHLRLDLDAIRADPRWARSSSRFDLTSGSLWFSVRRIPARYRA